MNFDDQLFFNSIHQYLFDVLTFFSNCQSNLIDEICREKENVVRWATNEKQNDERKNILFLVEKNRWICQRRTSRSFIVWFRRSSTSDSFEQRLEHRWSISTEKNFSNTDLFSVRSFLSALNQMRPTIKTDLNSIRLGNWRDKKNFTQSFVSGFTGQTLNDGAVFFFKPNAVRLTEKNFQQVWPIDWFFINEMQRWD